LIGASQRLPHRTGLLGIKPEVIGVAEHLLEDQPGAFELSGVLMGSVSFPVQIDRHIIGDLADPVGRVEAGHQNVGVGPIGLPRPDLLRRFGRGDLEAPPDPVVENRRENGRGVEVGKQYQPIEPSIPTSVAVYMSPISP